MVPTAALLAAELLKRTTPTSVVGVPKCRKKSVIVNDFCKFCNNSSISTNVNNNVNNIINNSN